MSTSLSKELDEYLAARKKSIDTAGVSKQEHGIPSSSVMIESEEQVAAQQPRPRLTEISIDTSADEEEMQEPAKEKAVSDNFSAWLNSSKANAPQQQTRSAQEPDEREFEDDHEEEIEEQVQEMDREEASLEQQEEQVQKKKGKLWDRMMSMFSSQATQAHAQDVQDSEMREDMKVLGQIAVRAVQKLPQHDLYEFKHSQDYERMVSILERYGLAKRKEKEEPQAISKTGEINIYRLGDAAQK